MQNLLIIIVYSLFSLFNYCALRDRSPVVTDSELKIVWMVKTSREMMSWKEANEYVANLDYHGYSDWRLPTKQELNSILNKYLINDNPFAINTPLIRPFRRPSMGYLFSGTIVKGYEDAPYVMNIRNGHISNGYGYNAYVRAVRDLKEGDDTKPKNYLGWLEEKQIKIEGIYGDTAVPTMEVTSHYVNNDRNIVRLKFNKTIFLEKIGKDKIWIGDRVVVDGLVKAQNMDVPKIIVIDIQKLQQ